LVKLLYLVLTLLLLVVMGCVKQTDSIEELSGTSPITSISLASSDSVWVVSDSTFHTIQVQVNGDSNPDSLWLELHADSTYMILLADDGGNLTLSTNHSWLLSNSGDLIPGDHIWSRRLQAGFAPAGLYAVHYIAKQNAMTWTIDTHWRVVNNQPPILSGLVAPDTLQSGEDSLLEVSVIDPDTGISNGITSVQASVRTMLNVELQNYPLTAVGGNQHWRLVMPYSFPSTLPRDSTGNYNFIITATDVFGATSNLSRSVYLVNRPPSVDTISLSAARYVGGVAYTDSVLANPTTILFDSTSARVDSVLFVFRVVADDPQSSFDVKSANVSLRRNSRGDTVIYSHTFLEGGPEDPVVGDGIFYVGFKLDSTNRPTFSHYVRPPHDTYHITFTAFDKGGNASTDTTFTFFIHQPGSTDSIERIRNSSDIATRRYSNPFAR